MENQKRYVVGLGEVLWDVLPEGKKLGGAPANFAYTQASSLATTTPSPSVRWVRTVWLMKQSKHSVSTVLTTYCLVYRIQQVPCR